MVIRIHGKIMSHSGKLTLSLCEKKLLPVMVLAERKRGAESLTLSRGALGCLLRRCDRLSGAGERRNSVVEKIASERAMEDEDVGTLHRKGAPTPRSLIAPAAPPPPLPPQTPAARP